MDNPILNYAVSEKTESNAWESLAYFCANHDVSTIITALGGLEVDFKEATKETKLPARYRSAKSVLTKAMANAIPILQEDGTPMPKTRLSRVIKEHTPVDVIDMDYYRSKVRYVVAELLDLQSRCNRELGNDLYDDIRKGLQNAGYI